MVDLSGNQFSGGDTEGATPVPISNTEVKLFRADDTMTVRLWESRTPPDLFSYNKNRDFCIFMYNSKCNTTKDSCF